jgi:hypothetical protein
LRHGGVYDPFIKHHRNYIVIYSDYIGFIYRAWPGWGILPNIYPRVAVKPLFDIYLFVVSSFAVALTDFLFTLLTMQLTKRCQFNGQIYTMDFPTMTEEQYATALMKCDLGALIQEAFFFLTADEREFIMTGTPPHVWEEMFAEQES